MSNTPTIRARGSGLPGRGGPRRWPTRWRKWVRQSERRKQRLRRLELKLRSWGIGYKTTTPYSFLLSFPRSGNHLIRYIIESISGYATWGASGGIGKRFTSRSPDTQIFLKVPMRIVSRKAIVIKRHKMVPTDDTTMSLLLLVRLPDHAIISHAGFERLETHLDEFVLEFVAMCSTVDTWPATTSLHFLESFTRGSDEEFFAASQRLLDDIHLRDFSTQLERFTQNRGQHFDRALWSLERRPKSIGIDWDSQPIRDARSRILSTLRSHAATSPTLRQIMNHYYGETSAKR